ncbi:MAG: hypothetical protein R2754_07455 [Microthrixaceae bacterium]
MAKPTLRVRPSWLVAVAVVLGAVGFLGFVSLQVPPLGLDEGAHITHAQRLRSGQLASHNDVISPELSSAQRCERGSLLGSATNPGYPIGARLECFTPEEIATSQSEFPAQQAQHTPVYYLPLALGTKVVDKLTDLDPLVDTYRVAALAYGALTVASLLFLGRALKVSIWTSSALTLGIVGTSGFIMAHSFVNNDSLAIPAGVALLLAARRVINHRSSPWALFLVSLAVTLVKPTFVAAQIAAVLFLLQSLGSAELRWRDLDRQATVADWRARLAQSAVRLTPSAAVVGGLVLGTALFQVWLHQLVPGTRSTDFTGYYTSRIFQADYFKGIATNLLNPLTQERPISFIDPSYGLVAMTVLEATVLWGTVVAAFGVVRGAGKESVRFARSGLGALVFGALFLFLYGATRGFALSSTNTRYLLAAVPFMFAGLAPAIDAWWRRFLPRQIKPLLLVGVAMLMGLQAVAVAHTTEPNRNNFWNRRQTGVLASFIRDDIATAHKCAQSGDTVAVIPFMPTLYAMTPGIQAPDEAATYWAPTLPREVRRAPYDNILDSEIDVVVLVDPQRVSYERTAAALVGANWERCAGWQPLALGLSHPAFEVYRRPNG